MQGGENVHSVRVWARHSTLPTDTRDEKGDLNLLLLRPGFNLSRQQIWCLKIQWSHITRFIYMDPENEVRLLIKMPPALNTSIYWAMDATKPETASDNGQI